MPNILTPEIIVLTSSMFEARLSKTPKPDEKPKFYGVFGFTKAATETPEFQGLMEAVSAAGTEKWGRKFDGMVAEGSVRLPFRKDVIAKGYPDYIVRFISCSSLAAPQVVSRFVDSTGKRARITDPREIYPGVRGVVSVSVRTYGGPGTTYNAGISIDLRNFVKLNDGERISLGGSDADEDFGPGEQGAPNDEFSGVTATAAAASPPAAGVKTSPNLLAMLQA